MSDDSKSAIDSHYLDFELEIGPGVGRDYPVTVLHSPAGETRERMHFPYDELALESRLKDLEIVLLHSSGERRQMLSREEQTIQDFGRDLFSALFTGEVRVRYDVSLREAKQQGKGLRLKLRFESPALAALPWEFLYSPQKSEYLCLSRNTPIVRYLEVPQPIGPLTITLPLRILGMVASPRDLPPLDIEREKQRIENALKDLQGRGLVELKWLSGQTWRNLQQEMRGGPWHIFHFIGHGAFDRISDEGVIALADEESKTHYLKATHLGRLLADHHSLRLVLLNSCEGARGSDRDIFSSTASILVRRGIPAVLAMQYEITDRAAIEFARSFYEALADGMAIDAATVEARKAISLALMNTIEWGVPVLHMRSPDGILFNITTNPIMRPPRTSVRIPSQRTTPSSVTTQVSGKYPVVRLINRLGVEVNDEVHNSGFNNDQTLGHLVSAPWGRFKLPLMVARGVHLLIPCQILQQVYEDAGRHIAELTDGSKIEGKMDGYLYVSNRSYPLKDVIHLQLLSLPKYEDRQKELKLTRPWQLQNIEAATPSFFGYNLRFAFMYTQIDNSTSGQTGYSYPKAEATSFHIKIGDEEMLAYLDDFIEITLSEAEPNQLSVKTPRGINTTGNVILRTLYGSYDRNTHKHKEAEGYNWHLLMDWVDNTEITLVLTSHNLILRRVPE
ncbi:MAG: CHAT domain-containing protein [Anaerolineae bacterium]|nr:CHAT domain-containing protein [Anaerolineae bacterium]